MSSVVDPGAHAASLGAEGTSPYITIHPLPLGRHGVVHKNKPQTTVCTYIHIHIHIHIHISSLPLHLRLDEGQHACRSATPEPPPPSASLVRSCSSGDASLCLSGAFFPASSRPRGPRTSSAMSRVESSRVVRRHGTESLGGCPGRAASTLSCCVPYAVLCCALLQCYCYSEVGKPPVCFNPYAPSHDSGDGQHGWIWLCSMTRIDTAPGQDGALPVQLDCLQ